MRYLFLVCCYLIFSSCNKDSDSGSPSIAGEWKMVSVDDESSGQSYGHPMGERDVIIKLTGNENGGMISGNTQTNTIWGSYSIGANRAISFPELGATQVFEPEWGNLFLNNFGFATEYQVIPGRTLVIITPNVTLKFSRN